MVDPAPSSTVDVRPSPIEGRGLFAWRAFRPGEAIRTVNIVRETTAEAPLRPELGERQGHCDYPDGRIVRSGPPDCHLNHSCDPNAWIPYTAAGCEIVARRAVQVGEEITCDYSINLTGGDAWSCRCGAARCRGTVVGDYFQLPPGLQREYAPVPGRLVRPPPRWRIARGGHTHGESSSRRGAQDPATAGAEAELRE